MNLDWSKVIPILAFVFAYYVWLFVNSERGVFHMRNYRVEKAKEPEEFRSFRRMMAIGGIVFAVFAILMWGRMPTQP